MFAVVGLEPGVASCYSELLQSDEHEDIPGDDTAGIGTEAVVEGQGAVVPHGLDHTVQHSGVHSWLGIHHSGLGDIHGTTHEGGGEASHGGTDQMAEDVVLHVASPHESLLHLVIGGQFGGIDDSVADDVRGTPGPQSSHTFLGDDLTVSIHDSVVPTGHSFRQSPFSLQTDLDHVSRVGDHDADCSGGETSQYLVEEGRVGFLVFRHHQVSNWLVKTDSDGGKQHLSLETGVEALVQRDDSFLLDHGADAVGHAVVLGLDSFHHLLLHL